MCGVPIWEGTQVTTTVQQVLNNYGVPNNIRAIVQWVLNNYGVPINITPTASTMGA